MKVGVISRILGILPRLALLLAVVIMVRNGFNEVQKFSKDYIIYINKTDNERKWLIHGQPYLLAKNIKRELPDGHYSAEVITDLDLQRSPGFILYRKLAYYLYPEVALREVDPSRPQHAILYFHKKNAEDFLPTEYQILKKFNNDVLFAVRK